MKHFMVCRVVTAASRHFPMSDYSGDQKLSEGSLEANKNTDKGVFFNCCKSGKNLSYDTGHN